jgi:hypothetical protein
MTPDDAALLADLIFTAFTITMLLLALGGLVG